MVLIQGFRELKKWDVVVSASTDDEGWMYLSDFGSASHEVSDDNQMNVRRRCWARLIVKKADYDRAIQQIQDDQKNQQYRNAYNLNTVKNAMKHVPFCVSLVYENERLKKRTKATDLLYFCKESMR